MEDYIPSVDPAMMADLHPLDLFEQLRTATMPQASRPGAPVTIPRVPVPAAVNGAAPSGDGWRGLLQMLAPVIGGLAIGGGSKQTGFLNGYSEGQQIVAEDRRRKTAEAQQRAGVAAQYLQKIAEQADQITDPVQHEHFVATADMTGAKAGLTQPGEIKGQILYDSRNLVRQQLKELTDQLSGFEKGGYNLDDLAQGGAILQLKDGTNVPIGTALDLTRSRPLVNGKPLARPEKVAGTEEERYIAKWAKENGLKVDSLTADQELAARKAFREAGRADVTVKPPAPASVDAQFNDLVELWKAGNPGKEVPAAVRTKLRVQAKKEIGQADDRPPAAGGVGGASGLDPDGIDYAATEYRVTGKMPPLGMGNGAARSAIINTAAKQAKTLGQSAAAAIQRQSAYKGDADALKKMTVMSAAAESFENKALAQADIVNDLSNKVGRSNYPIINDGLLTFKARVVGDADTQLLYNALTTFTTEYAKIMEGSSGSAAGSTDSARAAAARLISAGLSKGTLAQTIDLMKREMRLTIQGYDATKAHITERMGGKVPDVPDTSRGRVYYDANGRPIAAPVKR